MLQESVNSNFISNESNVNTNLIPNKKFKINDDTFEAFCQIANQIEIIEGRRPFLSVIWAFEDESDPKLMELRERVAECDFTSMTVRYDSYLGLIENTKLSGGRSFRRNFGIIFVDKFTTFRILESRITSDTFIPRGFFLFFMVNGKFKEYEEMAKILYEKQLFRVAFAYEDPESGQLQFDRISVFHHGKCWSSKPMKVVKFEGGKFLGDSSQIHQRDFENLYGCKVNVPIFHRPPALIIDEETNKVGGFDYKILQWLSEKMNFKINEIRLEGSYQWGTFNLTSMKMSGALKELYEGDAHLAIGAYILRSNRSEYFEFSNAYMATSLVITIPLGERYTSFEQLLKPFGVVTWSLMLTIFLASILAILIINLKFKRMKKHIYGSNIRTPMMNLITAILGGSQNKLPKQNFSRFLLMMLLVFCLVQRNLYQGLLFIFITGNQRHPEIQSLIQLADDRSITIYTYPAYEGLSPETSRNM